MKARHVYVRTARTYWRRGPYLLVLGLAVFVPLGLVDALADRAQEIDVEDLGNLADLGVVALVIGFIAQAITSLIGEIFYSGAVALALAGGEESEPPGFGTIARRLKYWRLIAVDLIISLGTALGLLALIVPGLVFFTWFALAGPVVELEGTGVRAAFRRSRELVRGHFWTVLLVLVPIGIASEILATGSLTLIDEVIHSHLLSDWVGEAATGVLLSPFYAVAAVLLTLELAARRERSQ